MRLLATTSALMVLGGGLLMTDGDLDIAGFLIALLGGLGVGAALGAAAGAGAALACVTPGVVVGLLSPGEDTTLAVLVLDLPIVVLLIVATLLGAAAGRGVRRRASRRRQF